MEPPNESGLDPRESVEPKPSQHTPDAADAADAGYTEPQNSTAGKHLTVQVYFKHVAGPVLSTFGIPVQVCARCGMWLGGKPFVQEGRAVWTLTHTQQPDDVVVHLTSNTRPVGKFIVRCYDGNALAGSAVVLMRRLSQKSFNLPVVFKEELSK